MAKGYKTGGREAGTPNKSTDELRITIQSFIENNIESMQSNFDQLEAKDKLLFIEKMLNYSLPKLKQVELTNDPDAISSEDLDLILTMLADATK